MERQRQSYFGVVRIRDGYLESIYSSRKEAEDTAFKLNRGLYYGLDMFEVVKGRKSIEKATKGRWTVKRIEAWARG